MGAIITRDDWLAALGETDRPVDQDAVTSREFSELIGLEVNSARLKLQRLVREGKAVLVYKLVTRDNGATARVPAYRLTLKKHKTS